LMFHHPVYLVDQICRVKNCVVTIPGKIKE